MKIGIIGGLGAYAGVHAIRLVNDCAVQAGAEQDKDFPEILFHQIPFTTTDFYGQGDEKLIRNQLLSTVPLLSRMDRVLFACNTYNHIADDVFGKRNISLRGFPVPQKSIFLASQEYSCSAQGRIHVPDAGGQRIVDEAIQDGITGVKNEEFLQYVNTCPYVPIIACTELSYAIHGRLHRPHVDTLYHAVQKLFNKEEK